MANVRIREQGKLTLKDSDNSNSISLQSPSTVAADQDFIVPNADGSANNIITTNASGTLSFTDIDTLVTSDIDWQTGDIKTGDFTAVAGKGYFVNTTSGTITATLPASPSAGDFVALKDYAATFGSNKLTIGRNGSNIQGTATNSFISTNRASVVLQFIDATKGWLYLVENNVGDLEQTLYVTATGGTITTSGDYKIHTFNSSGTFTVSDAGNSKGSNSVEYLIVAGGGGGGAGGGANAGGGAGAGGYRTDTGVSVTAQAYPITVGAGGAGNVYGVDLTTANPSAALSITSARGGSGGNGDGHGARVDGQSGGSGGGASGVQTGGGSGGNSPPVSPPQGNAGGQGGQGLGLGGGGGGGASAVGANASSGAAGAGGNGSPSTINGSNVTRAGGGGGGGNSYGPASGAGGGSGGGGSGATSASAGSVGTANTGGGGGGGWGHPGPFDGGNGGSGVVIIRYKYQN
jgi:hypothetical protein